MSKIDPVGGQAVINGVVMRSGNRVAVAVRKKGKIVHTVMRLKEKTKFQKFPFVRGIVNFIEMMSLGLKTLSWSASQAGDEELTSKDVAISFAMSLLFVVIFFIVGPYYLTKLMTHDRAIIFNLIDGAIRIFFFIIYVLLISRMKDIRTLFMYHGAEHKAVNCHEAGMALTATNARKYRKEHPRCGTSYIMIVFVVSILAFSVIMTGSTLVNLLIRIALIPVILSVAYELLKITAKYKNNFMMKMIIQPGIWFQKLTTMNPTEKQIEVAIHALRLALK